MLTIKRKAMYLLITALAVLIVLYVAISLISKYYINTPEIKRLVSAQVEGKINRKINFSDKINFHVSWDMSPHIQLHDVTLSNVSSSKQANMISIGTLDLNFSLWALLVKQIHINSIKLIKPVIYLENNNDKPNWEFDSNKEAVTSGNNSVKLSINDILITDGTLSYSHNNQPAQVLTINKLRITTLSDKSEFDVDFAGVYNKLPIKLTVAASKLGQQIKLDLIEFESGQSDLNGNLLLQQDPLIITGEINSTLFRVSDFSTGSASNANSSGEYQIPDLELPIEALKNSVIDLPIKIKALVLNKLTLNNVNFNINNKDSILNLNLKPGLHIAGGQIDANLNYDLKPKSPALNFNLTSSSMQLDKLMTLVAGKSPVKDSTLEIKTDLKSSGSNLRNIVNNLNGRFLATIGPGKFLNTKDLNANLFAMLLSSAITFDKRESSTQINCAVFNFHVNNGIASSKNSIGLEAASVNVFGSGKADLHNGRIDFTIKPQNTLKNAIDLSIFSVAQLINISGTISKPTVSLNPLGLLDPSGSAAKTLLTNLAVGLPGDLAVAAKGLIDSQEPANNVSPCKAALSN